MSAIETTNPAITDAKPAARNGALKRRALLALRVAVSGGLIYLILRDADLRAVFAAIGRSSLALVLLAFVLTMLGAVLVPAMTNGEDEPQTLVYQGAQQVAAGQNGRRIVLAPGSYVLRIGSSPLDQMLSIPVTVTAGTSRMR